MATKRKTAPPKKVKKVIDKAPKRGAPKQLTAQGDLLALLRTVKNRQGEMDTARGEMGNAVKQATERKYLDRVAFGIFRRLDRLPDVRLKNVLRSLRHYTKVGGLDARAEKQLDAFEEVANIAAKKNGKKEAVVETVLEIGTPPAQMDLAERVDVPVH
jgi:hypothetical protein